MNEALLISNFLLWVMVLGLSGIIVVLVRQIGVLYERVAPAGALVVGKGPAVGAPAPVVAVETLDGESLTIGSPSDTGRDALVFFLSPTCPICKELLPALRSLANAERSWLDVYLASDGPKEAHRAFVVEQGLGAFPYILSPTLGISYQVGKLPFAVLIDAKGILRARGLVNSREHLESLFEARERGVNSIQDYLEQHAGAQERIRA